MANHKSAIKRIRQSEKRRLHNRYYAKTMRSTLRKFRALNSKEEATAMLPTLQKMLDKLAKRNIIHWKKAANLKSGAMLRIAKLA
ncbi:MAG: 30S ribosomal protein S20 [Bacteroides sp.]|nr:30S ribosomal protein S20 [Roseburia sp.]MCM1345906.1 30S ribosomal protein S20 [Bacteroides sp.]MCM1421377.1 30S ribosomal protein S20 [Bacteroides sp.]